MAVGEKMSDFGTYAALVRRRRVWILTIVPAALLICVFLAFWLPPLYRSTATIILEQGSIPEDLIKSTVNSAEQQIEILEGRVMTIEALRALVKEYDPYPDQPGLDIDAKALKIVKDTSFERVDPVTFLPLEHSSAVSLYYQNPDPQRASIVTRKLADLFLTYHQRVRQESAKAAAKLVQQQADDLSAQLQTIDGEYARLRNANGGTLPDAEGRGGEDARYRAEHDLQDTERQLRAAQQQESQLSIQLSNISPNMMTTKGDLTDISTVRAQLAEALQRYTPEHPDVKRLQRALKELQAQGVQATQGKGSDALAATADNPEYRKTAGELAAARAEVSALQDATARQRAQLAQYTATVNPTAGLERQVADLERRRASLQTQFQAVQETLKNAQFGQQVESDPHAEHFVLIQSPYPASQPYSPNRLGIILLGLVLGGALAAGAVAITESSDPTVRGAIDIASLGNVTVLGNIPVILLRKDRIRSRLIWGSVAAVYIAALVIVIITVGQAQARISHSEHTAALAANGF
jgi:polysaccharide biosynthesis transport protein